MIHCIPNAHEYHPAPAAEWIAKDPRPNYILEQPEIHKAYKSLDAIQHLRVYDTAPQYITEYCDQQFEVWHASILCQEPGGFLPWHTDFFKYFREKYGETDRITRYNIFLQDRKPGHFLDAEGINIADWCAGEYLVFSESDWHCSSNAGPFNKYTCQVTGLLKTA